MSALVLLAASCGLSGRTLTGIETPPPQPSVTAIPSATPRPTVLLLSTAHDPPLEETLQAWATARGWGLEVRLVSGVDPTPLLAEPGLQAVVIGRGVADSASQVAVASTFLLVVVDGETVTPGARASVIGGLGTRHDEAGFLAGLLAGLVSRTQSVGLIGETGGEGEAVYASAFQHGVRYSCPGCLLQVVSAGAEAVSTLEAHEADVAFVIPGPEAEAALSRLAGAGLWVVWVGETPAAIPVDRLAGGVGYLAERLVPAALDALLAGEPGEAWPYSVANGGVGLLSLNAAAISPGRQRILEAAVEALSTGELDIGVDPVTGEER
jgi:basic membrane protein A